MRIIANTFAVFWSPEGSKAQFHADVVARSSAEAVARFRDSYPDDIIRSVRDRSGRFAPMGA